MHILSFRDLSEGLAESAGNIKSMQLLSTMHVLGRGISKDFIESYIWATIASKNGDETSLVVLNGLIEEMTTSQINKAKNSTMDK